MSSTLELSLLPSTVAAVRKRSSATLRSRWFGLRFLLDVVGVGVIARVVLVVGIGVAFGIGRDVVPHVLVLHWANAGNQLAPKFGGTSFEDLKILITLNGDRSFLSATIPDA